MITLLLIIFASAINACMETIKNHFRTSVFKKLNPLFWNHALRQPKQINAHMVLKTLMISFLILAVIFYQSISDNLPIDVAVYAISWMIVGEVVGDVLRKG